MSVNKLLLSLIAVALLVIAFGQSRHVMEIKNYLVPSKSDIILNVSHSDEAYRSCLRKVSAGVGVVNINQMQKCAEDTGYGK